MGEIPEAVRSSIAAELEALVRGERPEMLTWVRAYGDRATTLISQPTAI